MPSQTKYPGTVEDDGTVYGQAWTSVNNAKVQDGVSAEWLSDVGLSRSHLLKCTNFGFTIPDYAVINGVSIRIRKRNATNSEYPITDFIVQMIKGGAYAGDNKASASDWPLWLDDSTYGSGTDLWGNVLSAININSSNFGVGISAQTYGSQRTSYIDVIEITVYYTPANGVIVSLI